MSKGIIDTGVLQKLMVEVFISEGEEIGAYVHITAQRIPMSYKQLDLESKIK
jgi:hypothetical protein